MLPFTQMWGKKDIPSVRLITLNEPSSQGNYESGLRCYLNRPELRADGLPLLINPGSVKKSRLRREQNVFLFFFFLQHLHSKIKKKNTVGMRHTARFCMNWAKRQVLSCPLSACSPTQTHMEARCFILICLINIRSHGKGLGENSSSTIVWFVWYVNMKN